MAIRKHPVKMRVGQMLEELRGSNPSNRRGLVVEYLRAQIEGERKRALRLEAVARAAVAYRECGKSIGQETESRRAWTGLEEALGRLEPGDVVVKEPLPEWLRAPDPLQKA